MKKMLRMIVWIVLIGVNAIYGDQRSQQLNPTVFNIGGVLSSNESEYYFKETIAVRTTTSYSE